jgi:ABC-type antimicrobial peptide transport system permease subunit
MLAGGWLAVLLYRRRSPLLLMSSTIGGKVGALAGLLGFLFFGVLTSSFLTIETVVLHRGDELRAMLRSLLQQSVANNQDARSQMLLQWMQTPEGLTLLVAASMFLFLIAFLLLSTAGGIFAASSSRRRLR